MPDIIGKKSAHPAVVTGDYKSSDPAAFTLKKGAADGVRITVTPSAQTGAGNTVTVTVKDADTNDVLSTFTVTSATAVVKDIPVARKVRRITVTPVGSGTRTTLNYTVSAEWANLTYGPSPYWDGSAYVNSEAVNA